MKPKEDRPGRSAGKRKRTAFRRFADGAILDLVRTKKGSGTGLILFTNGQEVRTGPEIKYRGGVWLPSADPIIARIRLPQRVADASDDGFQDILSTIEDFLLTYIDFSYSAEATAAANWGLSTWFTHRLPMAPILSIAGPTGSGKTQLARCLDCICRRPLFLADLDATSLRSLPMRLRPTLILDELRLNDEMVRLLRAGTHYSGVTYRGDRPIDLYCPKVVITQEALADEALKNRAVEVRLVPTSRNMPQLTPCAIERFESDVLPHIFRFFLENYNTFTVGDMDTSCLSPHKRDVARALAAPYDTAWDQDRIVDLLQARDQSAGTQRFFTRESAVLSALLEGILQRAAFILASEVANLANRKLEKEGEWLRLSAKAAGAILNKLGFKTEKIGSYGRGVRMTQEVMKMVNNLGHHYGIFVPAPPVNNTETQKADAGNIRKKASNTAAVSDMSQGKRARKRKERA